MKKILIYLVFMATLLLPGVVSLEDGIIESASELDYPPFSIVTPEGEADGFSVELLRATLEAKGYEVTFYVGPWNEIKQDLADAKIQVLPLVGRTPEREPLFDFTEPYITFFGTIFVRVDNSEIKSIEDLSNKEVVVMKGDNAEEYVRRTQVSDKIISTETYDEAFLLLSQGKHDAIIAHNLVGKQIIEKLDISNVVQVDYRIDDFRQDFTFAVTEGDTELLEILNEGLQIVIDDGTFDKLHKKWFLELGDRNQKSYESYLIFSAIIIALILAILLIRGLVFNNKGKKRAK